MDVPDIVHDFDHIVELAAGTWQDRNGGVGNKYLLVEESLIRVKVGLEDNLRPGPAFIGRAATPPRSRVMSSASPRGTRSRGGSDHGKPPPTPLESNGLE